MLVVVISSFAIDWSCSLLVIETLVLKPWSKPEVGVSVKVDDSVVTDASLKSDVVVAGLSSCMAVDTVEVTESTLVPDDGDEVLSAIAVSEEPDSSLELFMEVSEVLVISSELL